jgi:predicted nucleotidyltransferase
METPDPLLERVSAALDAIPGVVAVALGGSRAVGAAHAFSDYDIGLYFSERAELDVERLRKSSSPSTGIISSMKRARSPQLRGCR